MAKRAILAGATGLVGNELLKLLNDDPRYDEVIVPGRHAPAISSPKIRFEKVDFNRLNVYATLFENVQDVFCCLGTTMKKAGSKDAFRKVDYGYVTALGNMANESDSCEHFVVISAVGVSADSSVFYNQVKGEMEKALMSLQLKSLDIFRPSILMGDRDEFRLGERIGIWIARAISPLFFGKMRKYKPMRAENLARAMIEAANDKQQGVMRYEFDEIMKLARGYEKGK